MATPGERPTRACCLPDTSPSDRLGGTERGYVVPPQAVDKIAAVPDEGRLYRFGLAWESADELASQAKAAEARGFPHGVSAFAHSSRVDASVGIRTEVERHFSVVQTGRNAFHHTIVLPRVLSDDDVQTFNELFGRTR